ncbi:MAG TPA: cytochrome P450 [Acidimicrobiales bacterium]|jgi:cytochrome P450|nr:cytochrome P450 [Acidimicrobiales bacterium]
MSDATTTAEDRAQHGNEETAYAALTRDTTAPQLEYKAMNEEAAVHRTGDASVNIVTRAAVEEVLQDYKRFSSGAFGGISLGNVRPLIPLSVDPPDHSKYRKLLDPLFAPKRMDTAEPDITARANRFMDAFVDRGECHFTNEFAVPFPSAVFLGLMGLPWEDLDRMLRMKDGIIRATGFEISMEEGQRRLDENGQNIYDYFNAILDEREKDPQDDILTQFLHAKVDGEQLSREEILDILFVFLLAGLDTVTDSLTCAFAFLAQHPEHRQQIVDDPSIIPAAVEELLRWESPVPSAPRFCTTDTEVGGCPVKEGDMVGVYVGAANVDTTEFPDAFDVRFDREVNRHLAFGGGVHRCLGSHLARREMRVVLREWHRRIPEYELKPGIELQYAGGLRSVENLELVWTAR